MWQKARDDAPMEFRRRVASSILGAGKEENREVGNLSRVALRRGWTKVFGRRKEGKELSDLYKKEEREMCRGSNRSKLRRSQHCFLGTTSCCDLHTHQK